MLNAEPPLCECNLLLAREWCAKIIEIQKQLSAITDLEPGSCELCPWFCQRDGGGWGVGYHLCRGMGCECGGWWSFSSVSWHLDLRILFVSTDPCWVTIKSSTSEIVSIFPWWNFWTCIYHVLDVHLIDLLIDTMPRLVHSWKSRMLWRRERLAPNAFTERFVGSAH